MARPMQIEVPPTGVTQLTGFIGAASRTIRNHLWRIEWRYEQPATVKRDGVEVHRDVIAANPAVAALHRDSLAFFSKVVGG